MAKESSPEMSSLAAKTLRRRKASARVVDAITYNELLEDAQALAGSVLSQDETKGQDDA